MRFMYFLLHLKPDLKFRLSCGPCPRRLFFVDGVGSDSSTGSCPLGSAMPPSFEPWRSATPVLTSASGPSVVELVIVLVFASLVATALFPLLGRFAPLKRSTAWAVACAELLLLWAAPLAAHLHYGDLSAAGQKALVHELVLITGYLCKLVLLALNRSAARPRAKDDTGQWLAPTTEGPQRGAAAFAGAHVWLTADWRRGCSAPWKSEPRYLFWQRVGLGRMDDHS